jgi:predicted GNAT superfamily acetyltransferase
MPIQQVAGSIPWLAKLIQGGDDRRMLPMSPDTLPAALALNNAHAVELSLQDEASFAHLVKEAFFARWAAPDAAFLIAFDQDADYRSENFLWFKARLARFVYVDRVVVSPAFRGQGHARRLYAALFAAAFAAGHERIVCEVNSDPPNPASDAFHAALGFEEVGAAALAGKGKTVRYLSCAVPP